MRDFTAILISPILKITGFRFSKHYRWGTTKFHSIVYRCVNTIRANIRADGYDI